MSKKIEKKKKYFICTVYLATPEWVAAATRSSEL